jgi:hypothetical protein
MGGGLDAVTKWDDPTLQMIRTNGHILEGRERRCGCRDGGRSDGNIDGRFDNKLSCTNEALDGEERFPTFLAISLNFFVASGK